MECLFCEIIKKRKNNPYVIAENEEILAVLDAYPVSDGHVLLITKKHFANIAEVEEKS
jgi:histidine triad (HIT) family protein